MWVQPQKRQNDLTFFPRQTIEHHGVQSLCAKHWCGRNWSWLSLWRPTRLSRTNTKKKKKRCPFHHRRLKCKVESQEIPGVTGTFGLGVQNEAGQRLTKFCQENALVTATLFQQQKRWLYTWTSPNGQYQNQTDYILWSQRWRSSIQSAKTRPGADCAQIMKSLWPNQT